MGSDFGQRTNHLIDWSFKAMSGIIRTALSQPMSLREGVPVFVAKDVMDNF